LNQLNIFTFVKGSPDTKFWYWILQYIYIFFKMHIFNIMILLKTWRVIIKQKHKIGVLILLKYTKYFFWTVALSVNNLPAVWFKWHSFCHSVIPCRCITCVCLLSYIISSLHFFTLHQSLVHSVQAQDNCEYIDVYLVVVLMLFLGWLYHIHSQWDLEILYTDVLKNPGYMKN
jgi:hypothetical protein